jgi:hypothetical protein
MTRRLALLSPVLVVAAACGAKSAPRGGGLENTPGARAADRSIRAVDWQNRAYDLGDQHVGFTTYAVKNGEYSFVMLTDGSVMERAAYDRLYPNGSPLFEASGYFKAVAPVFGDITGDGAEEAIVTTYEDSGGSGYFSTTWVFTMRAGQPVVLATIPGGDRADGGIRDVVMASDGSIRVARNDSTGGGACCPTGVHHEVWRWNGSGLVEDQAVRRFEKLPDE